MIISIVAVLISVASFLFGLRKFQIERAVASDAAPMPVCHVENGAIRMILPRNVSGYWAITRVTLVGGCGRIFPKMDDAFERPASAYPCIWKLVRKPCRRLYYSSGRRSVWVRQVKKTAPKENAIVSKFKINISQ